VLLQSISCSLNLHAVVCDRHPGYIYLAVVAAANSRSSGAAVLMSLAQKTISFKAL
jgi:hypothetical protein